MESKYINRYKSFCSSLQNLGRCRSADPKAEFTLEGTICRYNLTFDLSWKVMKDILVKQMGIQDYAVGSPKENLQRAFENGLINDDIWLQMLKVRNQLTHDYDLSYAEAMFDTIIGEFYDMLCVFRDNVAKYYKDGLAEITSFKSVSDEV